MNTYKHLQILMDVRDLRQEDVLLQVSQQSLNSARPAIAEQRDVSDGIYKNQSTCVDMCIAIQ